MNRKDFLKLLGTALASLPLARFIRPRDQTTITITNFALLDYQRRPAIDNEILQVINIDPENETITIAANLDETMIEFLYMQAMYRRWANRMAERPMILENYKKYKEYLNASQKED